MWAAWKLICLCLCLHTCCTLVLGEKSEDEREREYVDKIKKALNLTDDSINKKMLPSDEQIAAPPRTFSCDTTKPEWYTPATKVTELAPWDISIIGAMGDSVTAGFGAGAKIILDDFIEFRWLSWSIGGHEDISRVSTLPNIIRQYNDKVTGYSKRKGLISSWPGYNVAKSGAIASDMLSQAERLLHEMEDDFSQEELDNKWKIITLWIGGNDLCDTCDKTPEENAEEYARHVNESLFYLSKHFKRTYVNLVDMIDITQLMDLDALWCGLVHFAVCSCATQDKTKELVKQTARQYNVELKNMLEKMNYFNRDDFTVALQPFFSDTLVPRKSNGKADSSYFAPDCFHFSTKGHGVGALYLWNNMLEKQGEKTNYVDWDNVQDYQCISENNRYFTVDRAGGGASLKKAGDDQGGRSSDSTPIAVGSALAVLVVTIAAVTVVAVVVYRRKKKSSEQSLEKLQLIATKI